MTAHTPGPWEYLSADGVIVSPEHREIAWSDADYCLVAASPELLKALRAIVAAWKSLDVQPVPEEINIPELWEAADAAIAKAEG